MKHRLEIFEKKTVTNNVVSGSCGSGDPTVWELRGEVVNIPYSFVMNDPSMHHFLSVLQLSFIYTSRFDPLPAKVKINYLRL